MSASINFALGCRANVDGWCETHSTDTGPSWCVDALKDAVRRARFHERENYARWQEAEGTLASLGIRPWQPDDGDSRCKECGRPNVVWFADNTIWNAVMGDGHGVLCPTCFALRADQHLPSRPIWRLTTEARG